MKNTQIRFNFYSEQDAKGQTISESLSDSAKAVLTRVGDNDAWFFRPGVRKIESSLNSV